MLSKFHLNFFLILFFLFDNEYLFAQFIWYQVFLSNTSLSHSASKRIVEHTDCTSAVG